MKRFRQIIFLGVIVTAMAGCGSEPQVVEVTRIVNQEIPVTVEVIQEVAVAVTVPIEVPVEVTRLVEVVVTPTPEIVVEETAVPPTEPEATATPEAAQNNGQTAVSNIYTVQAGDNMSLISAQTGVSIGEIMAANNLTNASILIVGQQLTIPGWDGQIVNNVASTNPVSGAPPAPPPPAEPPTEAVPTGVNLLPNASFEEDWYFFNGVSEWQIPIHWSLAVDEGPNTLTPEEGDVFVRPEVRVVPKSDLPSAEHSLFVLDGNKTIKSFKGGLPIHFAVFTDISLSPGSYRFTIRFFPDVVIVYNQGQKVWAYDPLAAEARVIFNAGGTGWTPVTPGQRGALSFDFTLDEPATVRLGGDFRNRFINDNNGWFLDDWSLQRLEIP
ncbi:MAG TPA: LysM peptidoglycan-binding domain-containing protein [Chloroflexota bacterium]|nr:LysM peptidoglycan-binding domain-containing protein [Chloroflexota bacterium]HUM67919.1 LysM peptidoglycan-binding domain-containing protein [Chloroflexota bacterium]